MPEKNMFRKDRSNESSPEHSRDTTRSSSPSAESRHFLPNGRKDHPPEPEVELAQLEKKLHAFENWFAQQTADLIEKGVLPAQREEIIQAYPIEIEIPGNQRPDHKTVAAGLVVNYLGNSIADRNSENSPNIVYRFLKRMRNIESEDPEQAFVAGRVRQWLDIMDRHCSEIQSPSPEDTRTREEHLNIIEQTIKQFDETTHTLFGWPRVYVQVNELLRELRLRGPVLPWDS